MAFIMQSIFEARIERLIEKRNDTIRHKDYDTAWRMNMKIDKNVHRLTGFNY